MNGPTPTAGVGVRRLSRLLDSRAVGVLAGSYRSARMGAGLEFVELRPYQPGDDVRAIDWKVTARQHRPFVRVYESERSQVLWLLIDDSASLSAGIPERTPGDRAREIAFWLAAAALHHGDRVGLLAASESGNPFMMPRAGRGQAARVQKWLDRLQFNAKQPDLDGSARLLLKGHRRALVVVISDFRHPHDRQPWGLLARHHDLVPLRIVDEREDNPPHAGLIGVVDPTTVRRGWLDLNRSEDRRQLVDRTRSGDDAFATWCHALGVSGGRLTTAEPVLDALIRCLSDRRRGHRMARHRRRSVRPHAAN